MCENQHLSDMTAIDIALKYKDFKLAKNIYRKDKINKETNKSRVLKNIPFPDNIAYWTSVGLYPVETAYENLPIVKLSKIAPKAGEIVKYEELPEYYQFILKDYIVLYTYYNRLYWELKKLGLL